MSIDSLVALIQRSVAVEIDRLCVEPISNRSVFDHRRRPDRGSNSLTRS